MRRTFERDPRFTTQAIELRVFNALAPLIGWDVVPGSILQPRPRQPDLLCDLVGQGTVAVEFVSLDAQTTRMRLNNMFSTPRAWDRALEMKPRGEQQRLKSTLSDAYITADFRDEAKLSMRAEALNRLQSYLLGHLGRRGEVTAGHLGFPEGFHKVTIWRGGVTDGPHVGSSSGGYWQGPQVNNIVDHLQNTYQIDGRPLDLFAYSTHDDPDGHVNSLANIQAVVAQHLSGSQFRRVHVFHLGFRQHIWSSS
jgi:hypothetical protein